MPETIETIAQKRTKWVEANRENGFETGLKRLLTELYPDNAHFVYELLQNAEDARAKEVRFILHEDRIEFEHNGERLFSINDVDAITSIGFSTKRDDATNIGKFGVGFKAVFAYTETPEVESGNFHFKIHDMVVPKPDGLTRGDFKQTRFLLPFNNPRKPRDRARSEIEYLLKELDATTLLFLTHIRKIEYLLPDSSLGYIERIEVGDHRFEIRVKQPSEIVHSSTWFIRFDKEVQVEDDEDKNEEHKVKICSIAVAFALWPVEAGTKEKKAGGAGDTTPERELVPMEPGRVCIYFPADKETSNLRFHLHAPFASTVARDSVRDSAGNNVLRDNLADLLAESMHAIRDQGLLTVRALALLPNDKDNLPKFYQPLLSRLVREFQEQALVPMKRGGHAAASGIFRGSKALSDLIEDDDMVTLLSNDFVSPLWVSNPPQRKQREDNFLSILKIEEWTEHNLVSALAEMNDESLAEWMDNKDDQWHQRLYATLGGLIQSDNEDTNWDYLDNLESCISLKNKTLIRCSDGTYRIGSKCYFPTDEVENDGKFPRVAKSVFSSGKNKEQQKKARDFLASIGVCVVDERVEIEAILESYYTYDSNRPSRKDHYSHLRRFMQFLEENPNQDTVFAPAYLFMVDGGGDVNWMQPSGVYLDTPFMDTGLSAYYEITGVQGNMRPMSSVYEKSGISLVKLSKFCKALEVASEIKLKKRRTPWGFPGYGRRETYSYIDEDYELPSGLADPENFTSADNGVKIAFLIWKTMSGVTEKQLYGRYRPNQNYELEVRPSVAISSLKAVKWIPQREGKKIEFVQPRDAVAKKLPGGFEYQTGWQWLQDIEFGEGVEEQLERERLEKERQTQEYKRKEEVLREVGFDSPEEAEEMARLKKEDPEGFQKWRESRQPKPLFPERYSPDPERRKGKAAKKAASAPEKQYEKRDRSVRTSRTQGKTEVDAYLRDAYTNNDDQLICQICQDEMPFRKKNGKHYFERVEAFDLPQEHSVNHFALCPVCAAKYDEFIFHGPDDARDKLRQMFIEIGDALELPVSLGKEAATIRFVESHAIDLHAACEVS